MVAALSEGATEEAVAAVAVPAEATEEANLILSAGSDLFSSILTLLAVLERSASILTLPVGSEKGASISSAGSDESASIVTLSAGLEDDAYFFL